MRGAFIILWIILAGAIAQGLIISAGCFIGVQAFCEKGGGIKDLIGEIIAMVALILGTRHDRPPPPPPSLPPPKE